MNKLEIEIPEGQEIDWQESAKQERIVFKERQLITYKDVCEKLFKREGYYYIGSMGHIGTCSQSGFDLPNNASSERQLQCILAKNKLANVAVCLNNGWKPELDKDLGYCITLDCCNDLIIDYCAVLCGHSSGKFMFKSEKLAKQAIQILGEETVKLALEPLF